MGGAVGLAPDAHISESRYGHPAQVGLLDMGSLVRDEHDAEHNHEDCKERAERDEHAYT
jgi:hypothetical protein